MSKADDLGAWDDQTLQFYHREAPLYGASSKSGSSRWLDGFMRGLSPGSRILELGCGNGRDAEVLLDHGFEVDATDGIWANASLLHVPIRARTH
jgi:hypothetical protein